MVRFCAGVVSLLFVAAPDAAEPETTETPTAEIVLVTGEQPGPALWQVSSGDHDLWILGKVAPLPARVQWRSKQFEHVLANSQELLLDRTGGRRPDKQQAAAERKASKLPRGQTLEDLISPELYARATSARALFGDRSSIDKLHPFDAANRVGMSAIRALDLKVMTASIEAEKLARKAGVKVTSIATPWPYDAYLWSLEHGSAVPCLEEAVETVEDGGAGMLRLANAWSVGDIEALRQLVPLYAHESRQLPLSDEPATRPHEADKCTAALLGEQPASDFIAAHTALLVTESERVLRDNRSTIAVVSIADLFAPDGFLAELRQRGYEVIEPQ
ncbi:MAG TPA: TraB/GumN family protein [Povalibacter sp.]|uniref:TraB/GumN family protein n=1 Tax=Povalibacter sp. TaxID=1962978 RepID=UPI002BE3D513|nr:TraB/GumN family protein [Povalibacter sp.]HMN46087.1 TraB/GumN family protein [Povalibacter sp.]